MRIIQLKPDSEITIGPGKANHKFIMNLNTNCIREDNAAMTLGFGSITVNIQIFGDHTAAWNNYFKNRCSFSKSDDNTLSRVLATFSLIHSICDIDFEVI